MSVTEELKGLKNAAGYPPTREQWLEIRDSVEAQIGYRYGYRHAMDDAIEIAEEEEDG